MQGMKIIILLLLIDYISRLADAAPVCLDINPSKLLLLDGWVGMKLSCST
jgi:hypothetical protein